MGQLSPVPSQFTAILSVVEDSVSADNSRRVYRRSLLDFINWLRDSGGDFNKASVHSYRVAMERSGFSASTINVRMTAVRRLAAEAADNAWLPQQIAAGIGRVKGAKIAGQRLGNWLSRDEAEGYLKRPDVSRLRGKRDRALLAVLVGCGIRRHEATSLDVSSIQRRDGRWVLADVQGKSGRVRTVPMPEWAKQTVDQWTEAAGITEGRLFRAVNRGGKVAGDSMTPQAVYLAVREYADGVGNLAPHDLRRTFAKLAHAGGAPIEQIQLSLGHASIKTTERYLGIKQDLRDAPCDRLGLTL